MVYFRPPSLGVCCSITFGITSFYGAHPTDRYATSPRYRSGLFAAIPCAKLNVKVLDSCNILCYFYSMKKHECKFCGAITNQPDENCYKATIVIDNLLELLNLHGGKIVCTSQLSPEDIGQARASNRLFVDLNMIGYVWEPPIFKLPETEEEVEWFYKWYPLPVEMPENLKTLDWYFKEQENCDGAKCTVENCRICKNSMY